MNRKSSTGSCSGQIPYYNVWNSYYNVWKRLFFRGKLDQRWSAW